jgi:hypothetical protein
MCKRPCRIRLTFQGCWYGDGFIILFALRADMGRRAVYSGAAVGGPVH